MSRMSLTSLPISELDIADTKREAALALEAGQSLINRSYLSELRRFPVLPFSDSSITLNRSSDVRIFRIERIVQGNKQSVLESTTAAYTALGAAGYTVFLFLRSNGIETDLFIGTRGAPGQMLGQNAGALLRETFRGHFAGSSLQPLDVQETNALLDTVQAAGADPAASVTAVTGVPALSTENRDHFMQGLERFIDAAENRVYQAIILAEPVSSRNLDLIRAGYEQVATQLSPLLKQQISFGEQETDSVGLSISQGLSQSLGQSLGLTETRGISETSGSTSTETTGTSESVSAQTPLSKAAAIIAPAMGAAIGAAAGPFGMMLGAQFGTAAATLLNEQRTTGTSGSFSTSRSESVTRSRSHAESRTESRTDTVTATDSQSLNKALGSSRQVSLEATDKTIEQLLSKIDHHLLRIEEAKTYGGWNSAAYFIGDSTASSESLASIFLGLIRGSKSSHEDFALTTWHSSHKKPVTDWLTALSHPQLRPDFAKKIPVGYLTPATLVSGKEMAIQLSLPRRSTSTVAVVETQAFGRRVQRLDGTHGGGGKQRSLRLGNVRHLWENLPQEISLDLDQLTSHVFVSGSTGSGKSNTLYEMLGQISAAGIPFLVIEPAKGEYKHIFGQRDDVTVLGTHPAHSDLLRINPFQFPAEIHVLEHVDRLVEIFNVCWPMYAAMPAVLKDAILRAYEQCGWSLDASTNRHSDRLFPTFRDLLDALETVIGDSAYSQEVKGNYIGALSTRIRSLTNGLNGQIFSANEIDNHVLFDGNVIVDLSRIGAAETKALIMGVLVMRLSEHRMAAGGMNRPLRHVTVLEEAHNILKRAASNGGPEGASVVGKSVEMLVNAIAEMRTYGEGFVIVDQSPHAVDIAAIRNTNTKIILRLPDEADQRLIGKSIALRDDQLDEIARLPSGVAVVYQNDWLEPVLCKIKRFHGEQVPYAYRRPTSKSADSAAFNRHLLGLLLAKRVRNGIDIDLQVIDDGLTCLPLPARCKIPLYQALREARQEQSLGLWRKDAFAFLARLVADVLGCRANLQAAVQAASDFNALNRQLDDLLSGCVPSLPPELSLATRHCLMKDYGMQKENHQEIYAAWRTSINKGSVL